MNLRKIAGFATALLIAAPVGLTLGTGSATGATPAQTCKSLHGSATLSPGLTTTPKNQTVTANGTLANCAPSTKTNGGGTLHTTTTLKNASCGGLASGTTISGLKGSIKWKNGKTSAVLVNAKTTSSAPTTATLSGKVTSGLFAGKAISGKIQFTVKSGQNCTPTSPVKNLTFKNTTPFVI